MKTCVIIPTYNEARTIGGLVSDIKKKGLDVLIVDDGSVDETALIAARHGALLIARTRNKGKGASLRRGFKYVLKRGYKSLIIMDGDGQHNPEDIARFIKRAQTTDVGLVVGNRMNDTRSMPFLRRLTNRLMSYFISRFAGQRIPDTQCGFRLIKDDVLKKIKLISLNFEIESEMLIKAARQKFKILSIPIKTVYQGEASSINPIIDTLRFIRMLFTISLRKTTKRV